MSYPGGKNQAGVYHTIINLMPPHETYIEPFLGGGAILRLKRPASLNIGIDANGDVIREWQVAPGIRAGIGDGRYFQARTSAGAPKTERAADRAETGQPRRRPALESDKGPAFEFHRGDAINFLHSYPFTGRELVYCDPPYVRSSRSEPGAMYRHEMTDEQHAELLAVLKDLPCPVMVSAYWSKLYERELKKWNNTTYGTTPRNGRTVPEWLWFNFDRPAVLHDYRFIGASFRERQRIRKVQRTWSRKLQRLAPVERNALIAIARSFENGAGRSAHA